MEQRRVLREAQIRQGDREVFVNEQGEKMSRLKEVRPPRLRQAGPGPPPPAEAPPQRRRPDDDLAAWAVMQSNKFQTVQ